MKSDCNISSEGGMFNCVFMPILQIGFFISNFRRIKMKKRVILSFMALMLIVVLFAGCGNKAVDNDPINEEPVNEEVESLVLEATDDFGKTVSFETAPHRIISLAPSHTEILFALGIGDRVIGVTAFDDYPEEVLNIEVIGDFNGINLERIIELEPNLVINYGEGNQEENQRLEEAGIKVVGFLPESIEQIYSTIERIGALTGVDESAQQLVNNLSIREEAALSKVKDAQKVSVFYEIWHEPLMAAGPGSFLDQLINLAGGENIAFDADSPYPNYDMEQLVERNPKVYLTSNDFPEKTVESIKTRSGYENLDAVVNDRVYILDGNIMSRPGPRIIDALEILVEAIHPDK